MSATATQDQELDESWQTTSGLPLADADVEISEFTFGFNPKIGNGLALCANITFRDLASGEEAEQSFSTGQNWEATSKGAAAEKNGGTGKQSFSSQSNFGRLIDSAVKSGAGSALAPRGQTYQADTWIGTQWHTGTVKVTSTNPTDQKQIERDAIVFEKFLGVNAGDGAVKPATNGSAKGKGAGKGAAAELDADLEAALLQLAADSEDHDTFMAAALGIAEVADSKEATNAVMNSGKGSIWMRGNA